MAEFVAKSRDLISKGDEMLEPGMSHELPRTLP